MNAGKMKESTIVGMQILEERIIGLMRENERLKKELDETKKALSEVYQASRELVDKHNKIKENL